MKNVVDMRTEHSSKRARAGREGGGRTEVEVVRPPSRGRIDLHGAGLHGVAHENGLVHVLCEHATLRPPSTQKALVKIGRGPCNRWKPYYSTGASLDCGRDGSPVTACITWLVGRAVLIDRFSVQVRRLRRSCFGWSKVTIAQLSRFAQHGIQRPPKKVAATA